MYTINAKNVKKLDGKKLSTLVKKFNFSIEDFLDDNCEEMLIEAYELLKSDKVRLLVLKNDTNYDYVLTIDKYEAYCIFNY